MISTVNENGKKLPSCPRIQANLYFISGPYFQNIKQVVLKEGTVSLRWSRTVWRKHWMDNVWLWGCGDQVGGPIWGDPTIFGGWGTTFFSGLHHPAPGAGTWRGSWRHSFHLPDTRSSQPISVLFPHHKLTFLTTCMFTDGALMTETWCYTSNLWSTLGLRKCWWRLLPWKIPERQIKTQLYVSRGYGSILFLKIRITCNPHVIQLYHVYSP